MTGTDLIAALVGGGFASIVLEFILKPLFRFVIPYLNAWLDWNLSTEFSKNFYTVTLSVLNVALIPFMAWMGWVQPVTDPKDFAQKIILALLGALFSIGAYDQTLGRMKSNIEWRDAKAESEAKLEKG